MASLSFSIGQFNSSVSGSDAAALSMVTGYLKAYGLWVEEDTSQQKATKFLRHLAGHIKTVADSFEISDASAKRREEARAERESVNWG